MKRAPRFFFDRRALLRSLAADRRHAQRLADAALRAAESTRLAEVLVRSAGTEAEAGAARCALQKSLGAQNRLRQALRAYTQ